jgi:tRNA threonylcarbamoyladenosine biosynthesis protein TsaB
MALILHIETANNVCSVALAKNGKLLALSETSEAKSHARFLNPFIDSVLLEAKQKMEALEAVAISKGPGSYTGLRIGTSAAKGICYGLNIPFISIPTLQAMTRGLFDSNTFSLQPDAVYCPMIDARRMEVYCAMYDASLVEIQKTAAVILDEHSFQSLLLKQKIIFFGDGSEKCKRLFAQNTNAHFSDLEFTSAKNMIQIAEEKFNAKAFEDLAYFEPFYLKDFMSTSSKASI